ncbi:MAG: hypothetical protein PHS93_10100 [Candidatus Omnitrophica bacterium]|nr:hypothetical protein [Candidatus Omnitrophota bacterium]
MNFLKNLIDKTNTLSAMRFCLIFSFIVASVLPFVVWAALCIMQNKMIDLPSGIISFALGVLGIVATAKVFEKREEAKNALDSNQKQ